MNQDRREAASRKVEKKDKQGKPRGQAGVKKPQSPAPNPKSSIPKPELDDWIEIGSIVAPQGLAGEMRVYPVSDFPERFEKPGQRWLLRPGEAEPQPVELLGGKYLEGKNLYVIKLAGIEHRDQVEELRGCKLLVPESDRPQLGEDEYHVRDLLGLQVFMQESGEFVGTVVDLFSAGNDLLEVKLHQQEGEEKALLQNPKSAKTVLIPFVKAIAPVVDLPAGRIEITPPPGLLDID